MSTFASLFTGGGGADIGAMQAGLCPVWGVEMDSRIAEHARANALHVICEDTAKAFCFVGRRANRGDYWDSGDSGLRADG